jgi:general secretion pathway protein B
MSYILDALKKSEQERGRGSAPSVQTLHSSNVNYRANKVQLWPYVLLAAVVINLAALFYFILVEPGADTVVQVPATQHTEAAATVTPAITHSEPAASETELARIQDDTIYKQITLPAENGQAAQYTTSQVENSPPPAPARATVMDKDELPFDVQQHIPMMEFSAHVYSSNPLQRSIVINGRFMEEGDYLATDLFLSEITPEGAIFNYQGQLFHQGVVSAWN